MLAIALLCRMFVFFLITAYVPLTCTTAISWIRWDKNFARYHDDGIHVGPQKQVDSIYGLGRYEIFYDGTRLKIGGHVCWHDSGKWPSGACGFYSSTPNREILNFRPLNESVEVIEFPLMLFTTSLSDLKMFVFRCWFIGMVPPVGFPSMRPIQVLDTSVFLKRPQLSLKYAVLEILETNAIKQTTDHSLQRDTRINNFAFFNVSTIQKNSTHCFCCKIKN